MGFENIVKEGNYYQTSSGDYGFKYIQAGGSVTNSFRVIQVLSDAVITLPGGFGTFEELFEILTWIQLGLYQKPVGILNINGYYDFLEKQLDNMVVEGLLKKEHREGLVFSNDLEELFELMHQYKPIEQLFQLKKDET